MMLILFYRKKVDSLKDELKNQKIEFDMLSALHERLKLVLEFIVCFRIVLD